MPKVIKQKKHTRVKAILFLLMPLLLICLFFVFYSFLSTNPHYRKIIAYLTSYRYVLGAHDTAVRNNGIFYGATVDMSQLLPSSPKYVKNDKGEDLIDIGSHLGMNIFRITNATPVSEDKLDAMYSKEEWDEVLQKMDNHGIQAVILLESPKIHDKKIPDSYLSFVKQYLLDPDILSHSNVYAVDLYNEVLINNTNLTILKTASKRIKEKYPNAKLTVGWWCTETKQVDEYGNPIYKWDDYAAGKQLNSFIDFYSLHMYGFDKKQLLGLYPDPYIYTRTFINEVEKSLQTKKPLLIEEFGVTNGDAISDQDTIGSPQLQANSYAGVYQAISDMKDSQLLGTVAFLFHSRRDYPDAWAITKNHGNELFPAAYVLEQYATGSSDIPLSLPLTPLPNDYLLTNNDNNKNLTVKVGDIIGIKVSLDPSYSYELATTPNTVLNASELLTYNPIQQAYTSVLHAANRGTASVQVLQKKEKTIIQTVYTLTVTIE